MLENNKIKEEYARLSKGELPVELDKILGDEKLNFFQTKPKMATRQCSSSVIKSISNILPELIGGSADLSGSNNTKTDNSKVIVSKNFSGTSNHAGKIKINFPTGSGFQFFFQLKLQSSSFGN